MLRRSVKGPIPSECAYASILPYERREFGYATTLLGEHAYPADYFLKLIGFRTLKSRSAGIPSAMDFL